MSTRAQRTADKALNRLHAKILGDLAREPANKICADCHKKDPRWASWNLGVFICIRCSGIHRSLGTHISKVRSIDLDCWTPEQVENMQRWGNHRANLYWEANLRDNKRPTDYGMESWIRSKYEHKSFAMKGPIPEPESLDGASNEATETASTSTKAADVQLAQNKSGQPATSNNLLLMDLMDESAPSSIASNLSNNQHNNNLLGGSNVTPIQQQQQQPTVAPTKSDFDIFGSFTSAASASSQSARPAGADLFGFGTNITTSTVKPTTFTNNTSTTSSSTVASSGQPDLSNPNQDLKSYILSLYSQPSGGSGMNGTGHGSFGGL